MEKNCYYYYNKDSGSEAKKKPRTLMMRPGVSDIQYKERKRTEIMSETNEYVSQLTARAEAGDDNAQAELAACYMKGNGVPEDHSAGVSWYLKAAGQGNVRAEAALCRIFLEGDGVEQDFYKAQDYGRKAKDHGFNMVDIYLNKAEDQIRKIEYAEKSRLGKEKERIRLQEVEKRAREGDADAQYELGEAYHYGEDCTDSYVHSKYSPYFAAGIKKDDTKSFPWYEKAAQQGHLDAQMHLSAAYKNGYGVAKNPEKSFYWVKMAAEQEKDWMAMWFLAEDYQEGYGTPTDLQKALYWAKKAYDKNPDYYPLKSIISGIEEAIEEEKAEKERLKKEEERIRKELEIYQKEQSERERRANNTINRDISIEITGIITALLFCGCVLLFTKTGAGAYDPNASIRGFKGVIVNMICIVGIFCCGTASCSLLTESVIKLGIVGGIAGAIASLVTLLALHDYPVLVTYSLWYTAAACGLFILMIIYKKIRYR